MKRFPVCVAMLATSILTVTANPLGAASSPPIQIGTVTVNFAGHHLKQVAHVSFKEKLTGDNFKVMIALSQIRFDAGAKADKLLMSVKAENITRDGFDAVFETEGQGQSEQVAQWIAVGE
ncbi:H-type lectin domain-containing protein [Rhizobium ruizarguesonis]